MKNVRMAALALRLGLGVCFIYIGYAIWQDPAGWAGFIQPWAAGFLPEDAAMFMKGAAAFDLVVGLWLIIGVWTWLAALLAAAHLAGVIVGIGINDIAARDFGVLAGCVALSLLTMPQNIKNKLRL